MFTGIIENTGIIKQILANGTNKTFWISSPVSTELKIDQSVSHNGVCLTVEEINVDSHRITAIEETLIKTTLSDWEKGGVVNLERCLQMNGRLDGHIVQGHVDTTAVCTAVLEKEGSWEYCFTVDKKFGSLIIEKGSISLNGISLTIFNVQEDEFTVAIIPYTYEHTNMQYLQTGNKVNIEFDMIGKYVNRIQQFTR
ncbi:MAG: riboflavin synthase [Chitinophagaceae bacterium]|nr:riboflavin synthase [Chitinophagaceae bacterium]